MRIKNTQQYYFLHIPKAAGTSLRHLLDVQFAPEDVFPSIDLIKEDDRVYNDIKIFRQKFFEADRHFKFVRAHIPYWQMKEFLDPDCMLLTFLRNPFARALSELLHHKKRGSARAQKMTFSEIINTRKDFYKKNNGLEYYFGQTQKEALDNLNSFNFIGIQEQFNESLITLENILDVPLDTTDLTKKHNTALIEQDDMIAVKDLYTLQQDIMDDYTIYTKGCALFYEQQKNGTKN